MKRGIGGGLLAVGVLTGATVLSGVILSTPAVRADGRSSDSVTVTIPTSCTIAIDENNTTPHEETINSGQYKQNIGKTRMGAYCNDLNGYYIYAIGYSGNTDGNTNLISSIGSTYDIVTGTALSGDTSDWAMMISTADTGTTLPYVVDDYRNYTAVPSAYDVVAYRESATANEDVSLDVSGSYIDTTYQAYVTSVQPAGTYVGQVKYTLVHPFDATKLVSVDTAFRIAQKDQARLVVNDNNATDKQVLTDSTAEIPSGYSLVGSYYTMQDMSGAICRLVTMRGEKTQTQLVDVRDGNLYWVARLADNNCWMTQNLDLDLSSTVALNSTTSDIDPTTYNTGIYTEANGYSIDSNGVVSWLPSTIVNVDNGDGTTTPTQRANTIVMNGNSAPNWTNDYNHPYSADPGERYRYTNPSSYAENTYTSLTTCANNNDNDTVGCQHSHFGNYYNWSAAVANNNTSGYNSGTLVNSVCPKNWDLPVNGAYGTLMQAQSVWSGSSNTYADSGFNKLRTAPLYFQRFGRVNGGSLYSLGSYGYYWSSTVYNAYVAYHLGFIGSLIWPSDYGYGRSRGFSVRCMAN